MLSVNGKTLRARFDAASRLTNLPRAGAMRRTVVLLRKSIPRRKAALSLTLYDAFEAPVGTRETDQTLRAIVRRAWRAYFARLMPVWAGVLTFATVILGLPGLVLLAQALGPVLSGPFESMDVARSVSGPALGLTSLAAWSMPLTEWLRPTLDRFGLESLTGGGACLLAWAALLRAAGARQWYQSVYDDVPRRRLALTGLLAVLLPLLIGALLALAGTMIAATAEAPRLAAVVVWLVNGLALMLALFVVFLTFSLRRPAFEALLFGAGMSSLGLCGLLALSTFVLDGGFMTINAGAQTGSLGLPAVIAVLVILYLGWATVLAGSQLAVSLARREDPIDSFLQAGRGEQLDFGLRLVRDLEAQTRLHRWALVEDLATSLRAHPAMVTFALDRLRRSGLVEFDEEGRRPPRRWGIRDDLEALNLHDLSRAMGTHLEPFPGLHGGAAEDVIEDLAAREQLAQGQNLLSLFRDEGDAALAPGAPMLAVADARFGLADIDAVAGAPLFSPTAELVDRAAGDNGGPLDSEPGYIFVDAVLDESVRIDDAETASVSGAALDLTRDMRLQDDYSMTMAPNPNASTENRPGDARGQQQQDDDASPVILGQASPLAAVQREIDHLLDLDSNPVDAEGNAGSAENQGSGGTSALDLPPSVIAPLRSWHTGLTARQDERRRALHSDIGSAVRSRIDVQPAPTPAFVDPVASWRGFRLRGRPRSSAEPLFPGSAEPFAESNAATPRSEPDASSKASAPPTVPVPATVQPLHRITFGAT